MSLAPGLSKWKKNTRFHSNLEVHIFSYRGEIVTVVENRHEDPHLYPGWCCLLFTLHFFQQSVNSLAEYALEPCMVNSLIKEKKNSEFKLVKLRIRLTLHCILLFRRGWVDININSRYSIIESYLMSNPLSAYILNVYEFIWLGFIAYQPS